jgi:hypothetical protein
VLGIVGADLGDLAALSGTRIGILNAGRMGMVAGSTTVLRRDVGASNGMIHIRNGVLTAD